MTESEFQELFNGAIETAVENSERQLRRSLSREVRVILHGAGHAGEELSPEAAGAILYLGEDKFYRIIDVAVVEVCNEYTKVFVRASSHAPTDFEGTWNDPPGSGPFKQLIADEITIADTQP